MEMGPIYQRSGNDSGASSLIGSDSDDDESSGDEDILARINAVGSNIGDGAEDGAGIETGTYNDRFITKLVKNYRSHPDILKVKLPCFGLLSAPSMC